jgi:hypothetical protein
MVNCESEFHGFYLEFTSYILITVIYFGKPLD